MRVSNPPISARSNKDRSVLVLDGSEACVATGMAARNRHFSPSLMPRHLIKARRKKRPTESKTPNLARRNDAVFFSGEPRRIFGLTFLLMPVFPCVHQSVRRTCGAIAPQIFVSQNENEANGVSPRFLLKYREYCFSNCYVTRCTGFFRNESNALSHVNALTHY